MTTESAIGRFVQIPQRAMRFVLRKATRSRVRNVAVQLTRESGLDPLYAEEVSFWATELLKRGYHTDTILDRSRPERMHRCFPEILRPLIEEVSRQKNGRPKVADVGSGPLSELAHAAVDRRIDLTAIDPLADVYRKLLDRYGYHVDYSMIASSGEQLLDRFTRESFDIVWMRNALDHSNDPALVLRNLVSILGPGGYLVFGLFSREGTAEHFHGLHRNDMYLDAENRLMLQRSTDRGVTLSAPVNIAGDLPLDVVRSTGPTPGIKEWFQIVWRKQEL